MSAGQHAVVDRCISQLNFYCQVVETFIPGQKGGCSDVECLTAIQTVLDSCSTEAAAAWLMHLGRVVGRWAAWAGSQGTAAVNREAALAAGGGSCLESSACMLDARYKHGM